MASTDMTPGSILFYLDRLEVGGVERIVLNLLSGLTERGWRPELALNEGQGDLLDAVPATVPLHVLDVHHFVTAVRALSRTIRQRRPALVVSQRSYLNAIATLATLLSGHPARLVLAEHTLISSELSDPRLVMRPADHLLNRINPFMYRMADVAIAVSEGVARDLKRYMFVPDDKLKILYNPIVPTNLDALIAEPAELPWAPDDRPLILSIGRLSIDKGYEYLIEAFAQVRTQVDARLALVGSGPQQSRLAALTEQMGLGEHVRFLGYRSNPFACLRHASLFALSSIVETFPTVLIEAMAASVPVVSFDCPQGPREIVTDGRDGLLVPSEDARQLATAMLRVLREPSLAARLRTHGRERARAFTFRRTIQAYEDLFCSLIRPPVRC